MVKNFGLVDYLPVWQKMQDFTNQRSASTVDELWLLQHPAVFTLGRAGKKEHLLAPGDIPVVQSDRGGQVTYHGPGQLVGYLLIDLRRLQINIRQLVSGIEMSIIQLLATYGVDAQCRKAAPGVYVADKKVAALGLRIRRGCSFHGFSLNVAMDVEPFGRINPCGYPGLKVIQLRELGVDDDLGQISEQLVLKIQRQFGYDVISQEQAVN